MHWTQLAYLACLCAAILAGRPRLLVVAVMAGNFVLTAFLAESPLDVALADIAAAVILIGPDKRQNIVAAIYCLMVPVYVIADAFSLSRAITFTIIDCMALVQLAVIGHVDGGLRRIATAFRTFVSGRHYPVRGPVASRDYASGGHRVSVRSEKVTHGRQ